VQTSLPREAAAAADRGDVIGAIKITRERTGVGLKAAKDAVDAYTRGADALPAATTEEIPSDAVAALYQGRLIDAIKKTRAKTGLGLKDAKAAVERHLATNTATQQRFQAAAVQERQGLWRFVKSVLVAGVVVLVYLWLSGRLPWPT
jgi:ribosomal protein L7/L12